MKFKVTISRDSNDNVNIRFKDLASGQRFATATLSLEQYAWAITGLSDVECDGDVSGLDVVGMTCISESRTAVYPGDGYDKVAMSEWLVANCQEPGWRLDPFLGSQRSIGRDAEGCKTLHYRVFKYVATKAQP